MTTNAADLTNAELVEIAMRAVAADLTRLRYDRPDVTARLSSGSEIRFVHSWIKDIVEDLQDRLATRANDHGIDLQELA